MKIRQLALLSALALAVPAAVPIDAQAQWGGGAQVPAYREGYDRGLRAGEEDSRRNQSFDFTDESDYRRADAGYRSQYGNRDRYRADFRRGYEEGYRAGYGRYGYDDRYDTGRRGATPPWSNGRGWARGRARGDSPYGPYGAPGYNDLAFTTGYNDGYEAGLDDGRDRRRNDPIAEGRFRSADHGYRREYGTREAYKIRYRDAFRQGYERGYNDGRRNTGTRWWWPF
jgi:flagellar biosynthesis/type III secretory pathway protein FliH